MKVVCTICTDEIREDFCASPCGHTFHFQCLSQWLTHQKTCPQCRERCQLRSVIKLYVNSNDLSLSSSGLDPEEMRDKLSLQETLMTAKDKALAEAKGSLDAIQKEMKAWQAQHRDTHRKLMNSESNNAILKREVREAEEMREEVTSLRARVSRLEGVEKALKGCKEDVDELVTSHKTSNTTLATIVVALKRDYEVLKGKKSTLVKEKSKLAEEIVTLKKELANKEKSLQLCQDQVSMLDTDFHSAEKEKNILQAKMEMLQEAIDSPGSRVALKRILESPMPEQLAKQPRIKEAASIGASPLLVSKQHNNNEVAVDSVRREPSKVGPKRPRPFDRENYIIMPVSKVGRSEAGSQQPKTSSNVLKKELKFAPRKNFGKQPKPLSFYKW